MDFAIRAGRIQMTIVEIDKVDAAGIDNTDETILRLMISDHLDWREEYKHLQMLQDKINGYLEFIEAEEYVERFGDNIKTFIIDIHFLSPITENCAKFLETVSAQLESYNIFIESKFE